MIQRIKDHIEYKRNTKIVKRELAKIGVSVLPAFNAKATTLMDLINFANHVINECNKLDGDELIIRFEEMFVEGIKVFANKLETDEARLFEIIKYISNMSTEDIRKVIINAQVETMNNGDN